MGIQRVVITGGPGTGKTSIINELLKRNFDCMEEISRQVTLKAKEKGIDQLFLTNPLLFSNMLLEGRIDQYKRVENSNNELVFMDRGIPDVLAYMNFIGQDYPDHYNRACKDHIYDLVFILAPWQEIYVSDNERYENFEQAILIHEHLLSTYKNFNYKLIDVPFGSVESRTDFITDLTLSTK